MGLINPNCLWNPLTWMVFSRFSTWLKDENFARPNWGKALEEIAALSAEKGSALFSGIDSKHDSHPYVVSTRGRKLFASGGRACFCQRNWREVSLTATKLLSMSLALALRKDNYCALTPHAAAVCHTRRSLALETEIHSRRSLPATRPRCDSFVF